MNSTNAERMNLPIRESLGAESPAGTMTFHAGWRTAVELVSGHTLQKVRLALASSVSELLLTLAHGSNDNDRNINLLRPSHLPVSA